MLLLLRKMKRTFFANKQFHNYLFYAVGEMLLVVVGILIALQIDNWNEDNQRQESLVSYLNSIARNIGNDLAVVNSIRTKRELADELSHRHFNFINRKVSLNRAEIGFFWHALDRSQELHYFNANTSGYEALKTSGVMNRLQGSDIEYLLHDYYNTVSQIAHYEQDHNEYLKLLWLQVVTDWPRGLAEWELEDSTSVSDERFQSLQPAYAKLRGSPSTEALFTRARQLAPLMHYYDRLHRLGSAFARMVEAGTMNFDQATIETLDSIYDPDSGAGYPNVIVDGQIALQSYEYITADSNNSRLVGRTPGEVDQSWERRVFDFHTLKQSDRSLHIAYPGGADWAGIWVAVSGSSQSRTNLDFSSFDALQIEIKGDLGGEKILLNMEDVDDPMDGSSTRYELTISDEWQIYTIDLAEFKTADLGRLNAVIGFVFLQDNAQAFSVRTVRFIDSR